MSILASLPASSGASKTKMNRFENCQYMQNKETLSLRLDWVIRACFKLKAWDAAVWSCGQQSKITQMHMHAHTHVCVYVYIYICPYIPIYIYIIYITSLDSFHLSSKKETTMKNSLNTHATLSQQREGILCTVSPPSQSLLILLAH